MMTFLNDPDDVLWLQLTHLAEKPFVNFHSFVLYGNEDCPTSVHLYADRHPDLAAPFTLVTFD